MDAGVSGTFHLDLENMLATTLKVDAALSCRVNGIEEHWRSTFRVLILGLQPRSTYRALILGATRTIRKSSCGATPEIKVPSIHLEGCTQDPRTESRFWELHPRYRYRELIWRVCSQDPRAGAPCRGLIYWYAPVW